jgi:hypothetical protein
MTQVINLYGHKRKLKSGDIHPQRRESGKVYMDELCKIIDRKSDTVRRWQGHHKHPLPSHLLPKKGTRGWRYWTDEQVWGEDGIIAWMKTLDLRPGRVVTPPHKEHQHVARLRKPKYLTGDQLRGIRDMVEAGKTRRQIVNRYFKRTRYVTKQHLERALEDYFKSIGMDWPTDPVKTQKEVAADKRLKRGVTVPQEYKQLERRAERLIKLSGQANQAA